MLKTITNSDAVPRVVGPRYHFGTDPRAAAPPRRRCTMSDAVVIPVVIINNRPTENLLSLIAI